MIRANKWLTNAVDTAPIAIPVAIAAFGLVAMIFLLANNVANIFVWPLGLIAAGAAVFFAGRLPKIDQPGSILERRSIGVLALLFVLVWGAWNGAITSQHIFTNRDPATYANAAAWLVHHDSLKINTPALFTGQGFTNDSPGFDTFAGDASYVSAQGQHLFPLLLGLLGRIVGANGMLRMPVLFGMAALLAVYGFARLILQPRWALLATVVLGLSLPMLYFTRDTYTEPLTLCFLFAGLALFWIAHKTQHLSAWLLAGLVVGASTLVRFDVYISIAGFVVFLAIALAAQLPSQRKMYAFRAGAFLAVVAALACIAFVDTTYLSAPYLAFHKGLLKQEILGLVATAIAGVFFVLLSWHTQLFTAMKLGTRKHRPLIIAMIVLLISVVLVSRPLWFTGHTKVQDPGIAALQSRESLPVEPRSYTEQSTNWVSWYIGAPLAVLGVIGLAMMAARGARKEQLLVLCGVSVVAITALVYFVQPSIAPDQIWASRRYVPIVLPGLVIYSMVPLAFLWRSYSRKFAARPLVAVLFVAFAIAGPLLVSRPFVVKRDVVQAPIISGVCSKLPKNAAVLWVGDGQYYLVQPTRSFCNAPAFSYTSRTLDWKAIDTAASKMKQAGYQPVLAIMNGDKPILGKRITDAQQVSDFTFKEMEMRLSGPPQYSQEKTMGVSLVKL